MGFAVAARIYSNNLHFGAPQFYFGSLTATDYTPERAECAENIKCLLPPRQRFPWTLIGQRNHCGNAGLVSHHPAGVALAGGVVLKQPSVSRAVAAGGAVSQPNAIAKHWQIEVGDAEP